MTTNAAGELRRSTEETERRLDKLAARIAEAEEALADALAAGDSEEESESRERLKELREERDALESGLEGLYDRRREAEQRERLEAAEKHASEMARKVEQEREKGRKRAERALEKLEGAADDLEAAAEAIPSTAKASAEVEFLRDLLGLEVEAPKRLDLADLREEAVKLRRELRRVIALLSGPGRKAQRVKTNLEAVGSDTGTRHVYSRAVSGIRNLSEEGRRLATPEIRERLEKMHAAIREQDRNRVPSPDQIAPEE